MCYSIKHQGNKSSWSVGNLNEIHPGVDGHIATVNVKDKTNVPRLIQVPQFSDAEKKHPMMDFFCPPDRRLVTFDCGCRAKALQVTVQQHHLLVEQ